ncbi:MAG: H-X9-DG-CTERM domain-containing protein, partial [Victivallaceae bacterium]
VTWGSLNAYMPSDSQAQTMSTINDRHGNGANSVWADGHASFEARASWDLTGRRNGGDLSKARYQYWKPQYRGADYRSNF